MNATGFPYHLPDSKTPVKDWHDIVAKNNGYFDIVFDKNKNLVIAVHGKSISTIAAGVEVPRNFYNRAVRMRNKEVAVGFNNNQVLPATKDSNAFIEGIRYTPVIGVTATPIA